MRRRTVLASTGACIATALAGCSGGEPTDTDEGGSTPTDTPTDTATETPTDTSTDTPTETPTPEPEPEISVVDHQLETVEGDYYDTTFVHAFVENTGGARSGLLEPEAIFYDESGDELATDSISQAGIPPGDTWEAFVRFTGDGSPADYEFQLAHDSSFVPQYGVPGAEVVDSSLDTKGDVKVNGTVKNTGEGTLDYLEVDPHIYAADGNLLWIGFTNVTDLGAGETWEFSYTYLPPHDAVADRVDDYTLALTDG